MADQAKQRGPAGLRVLAIETSCDDTSVAFVCENGWVDGVVSANQDLAHSPFGGVVPEIASRNHTLTLLPLIETLLQKTKIKWSDVQGIAVTSRPGLMGSLMVGVVTAKTLAAAHGLPIIGVNHLEGHLLAPFLRDEEYAPPADFQAPYLALAISGGHTQIYDVAEVGFYTVLGKTIDDAAGEAFDKFAKMLGLPFPGGVFVDKLARNGDTKKYKFPRPLSRANGYGDDLDFSFSGLKTSALRMIEKMSPEERKAEEADLCASYQEAIVDTLLSKLETARTLFGHTRVVLTGGVSANSRLRDKAAAWAKKKGVELIVPPIRYCTDNAAMIGYVGATKLKLGQISSPDLAPSAYSLDGDFKEARDGQAVPGVRGGPL